MLSSLYTTSQTTGSIELLPLLACIACALACGALLAVLYSVRSRRTVSFVCTVAVLPAIVCVVIALVNGNVGAGVAVAGAFSLIRFRSVPGSAKDIGFVFLAMCVGLACGMGYLTVAGLCTAIIGGAYMALNLLGSRREVSHLERCLRITVPEDLDYTTLFDDVLDRYVIKRTLSQVKTANMGSLYKLTYLVTMRADASERDLLNDLRCRNGNMEVSLSFAEVNNNEL